MIQKDLIRNPTTFWLTGLSGAGKSTYLPYLVKFVKNNSNLPCLYFDGDQLRYIINISSYDLNARIENGLRYSRLCKNLNEQAFHVVIACIALYPEIHKWNIKNIQNLEYVMIDVPISELISRDPKGIYKKSIETNSKDIVGIDIPASYPEKLRIHYKWVEGDNVLNMIEYCNQRLSEIYRVENIFP